MKRTYEIKGSDMMSSVWWFLNEHPEAVAQCEERWGRGVAGHDVPFSSLTVGDLCEVLDGGLPESVFAGADTVAEYFRRRSWLAASVKSFADFLAATVPPRLPGDMSPALEPTTEEAILLTCKNFYGLHSLAEAQALTVAEYMIARKEAYNEAMARRAAAAARGGRV